MTTAGPSVPRVRMSRAERRALLLRSARALFAERGYDGTSTADLARAAACSEAVIYQHFDSKQDLFVAVLEEQGAAMRGRLERAVAGTDDPFAALAAALGRRVSEAGATDALKLRSLAVTMADEPQVREVLERLRDGFTEVVERAVRDSQAAGRLRDDVDPEHVTALFAGLSFLGAFTSALGGDGALRRLAPVAQTLVRALEPPADGSRP